MNRYYGFDLGDAESAVSRLGKKDAGMPEVLPVREAKSFVTCTDMNTPGMIRISFGVYNNEEEVDKFLEILDDILATAGNDQENFDYGIIDSDYGTSFA